MVLKDHKVARGILVSKVKKEVWANRVTRESEVPLDHLVSLELRDPLDQWDFQDRLENQDLTV